MAKSSLIELRRLLYSIVCGAMFLLCTPLPAMTKSGGDNVIGRWRLIAALDSAEIASLDEDEARALVGRFFVISKSHVTFGNRDCGAPELTMEHVEPELYLREQARASGENLNLPNPVSVVDLGCTVAFVKRPDRLVILWKGWFFDAVRVKH